MYQQFLDEDLLDDEFDYADPGGQQSSWRARWQRIRQQARRFGTIGRIVSLITQPLPEPANLPPEPPVIVQPDPRRRRGGAGSRFDKYEEFDEFGADLDFWDDDFDRFTPPSSLPRVTNVRFSNTGHTHPNNCCASCPIDLGVGIGGTAANGMEMQFTLSGHRPGIWYDVLRTRRNSLWERRAGVWHRLESQPMGTWDDRHNQDECLRPRGNRIFVIDTPGFPGLRLPAPVGTRFVGLTGATTHADATDVVFRLSFAEWVNAKSRDEGINWTSISPGPHVFWHSITWLTRNAAGQWILDRARSRIARGSLSWAVINAAPT